MIIELIAQMRRDELTATEAGGWQITQAAHGMNGVVYRAQHDDGRDHAVKVTLRDPIRDRAGREFAALTALQHTGVTPAPVALYRDPPELPEESVVVAQWINGERLNDQDRLNAHRQIQTALLAAHRLSPQQTQVRIAPAVMPVLHPDDLLRSCEIYYTRLPEPDSRLQRLIERARMVLPARWGQTLRAGLIQCDAIPNNALTDGQRLVLVDWENSGWADPAFDIADMLAKPVFGGDLNDAEREMLAAEHGERLQDADVAGRVRVYVRGMIVWWAIRLTLQLAQPPRRIAGVDAFPRDYLERQQKHYLAWAADAL